MIGSPYPDLPPDEGGPGTTPDRVRGGCAAFFRAEIERIITHCDAWEPPTASRA